MKIAEGKTVIAKDGTRGTEWKLSFIARLLNKSLIIWDEESRPRARRKGK